MSRLQSSWHPNVGCREIPETWGLTDIVARGLPKPTGCSGGAHRAAGFHRAFVSKRFLHGAVNRIPSGRQPERASVRMGSDSRRPRYLTIHPPAGKHRWTAHGRNTSPARSMADREGSLPFSRIGSAQMHSRQRRRGTRSMRCQGVDHLCVLDLRKVAVMRADGVERLRNGQTDDVIRKGPQCRDGLG